MTEDTSEQLIAEMPKNSREVWRVITSRYRGHDLVGARAWAEKKDGARVPTKNGITIRRDQVPAMIAALQKAVAQ